MRTEHTYRWPSLSDFVMVPSMSLMTIFVVRLHKYLHIHSVDLSDTTSGDGTRDSDIEIISTASVSVIIIKQCAKKGGAN